MSSQSSDMTAPDAATYPYRGGAHSPRRQHHVCSWNPDAGEDQVYVRSYHCAKDAIANLSLRRRNDKSFAQQLRSVSKGSYTRPYYSLYCVVTAPSKGAARKVAIEKFDHMLRIISANPNLPMEDINA